MFLVVEGAEVAIDRSEDASDRSFGAHRPRQAGGNNVDFVAASDGQADVGRRDSGLEQNAGHRRRTGHGADIQLFIDQFGFGRITIDNDHAVTLIAEQIGDGYSHRPGSEYNNIHAFPNDKIRAQSSVIDCYPNFVKRRQALSSGAGKQPGLLVLIFFHIGPTLECQEVEAGFVVNHE